jgi:hypothetical protein
VNGVWNYINGGWVNAGSNLLGYVTVASLFALLWREWQRTCGVPHCVRLGKVAVKGTTKHLCPKHSTRENHEHFQRLHDELYPDRVGHS